VVRVVRGSERALKVTDAGDFALVEALYAVDE
jgi:2-C-methyl-D-erythritol 4-phosphate cytidylyltransferase